MASTKFQVTGIDNQINEVRRIAAGPGPSTIAHLNASLAEAFAFSQSQAHVEEGHMIASAARSSEYDHGSKEWRGEVSYDDPAAVAEVRRGEDHARFLQGIPEATDLAYEAALIGHFRD